MRGDARFISSVELDISSEEANEWYTYIMFNTWLIHMVFVIRPTHVTLAQVMYSSNEQRKVWKFEKL